MAWIDAITSSDTQTLALGRKLGKKLAKGSVVCFFGDLAAGKTTFIKGLVAEIAGKSWEQEVNSPTFVYLNIYEGDQIVYHFDLYRLNNKEEFLAMGFDEFLSGSGICCIEWAERIESILPELCIQVRMKHEGESSRRIIIKYPMEEDGV